MSDRLPKALQLKVNALYEEIGSLTGNATYALYEALEPFVKEPLSKYTVTYTVTQKATYSIEVEAESEEDAQKQLESGDVDPADGDEQETEDLELDEVVSVEEAE